MRKLLRLSYFSLILFLVLALFPPAAPGQPPASPAQADGAPVMGMIAPQSALAPEQVTPEERERLIQEAMNNLWRYLPDLETHRPPTSSVALAPQAENGQIAYVGADGYLYLMPAPGAQAQVNPDGTGQHSVVTDLTNIADPAWSPDSQWLAFIADGSGDRCLYKLEIATSAHTAVACGFISLYEPFWSPDGEHLAFYGQQVSGYLRAWAVPAAGGAPVELAPSFLQVMTPRWLDADTVLISGENPANIFKLYRVDLSQSDSPTAITPEFRCSDECTCDENDVYLAYPHLSPDATTVSFVGGRTEGDKTSCTGYYAVYLVDPQGSSSPSKIVDVADTSSGMAVVDASQWAPDNRRVGLYASGSDGVLRVNVVDTITGILTMLHGREGGDWDGLTWAPDATQLAVGHLPGGTPEVDAVDPDNDAFTLLAQGDDPAWGTLPPASPIDLEVTELEVTQAIQHLDEPYVPLIEGKGTWVRVFARSNPDDVQRVKAKLYLVKDGQEQELDPINQEITVRTTDNEQRSEKDHTFNFLLPSPEWTTGTINIRAEVGPNKQFYESNYDNNVYPPHSQSPRILTFDKTRRITVNSYRFRFKKPDGTEYIISHNKALASIEYTQWTYPVAGTKLELVDRGEIAVNTQDYNLKTEAAWQALVRLLPCDHPGDSVQRCFGWLPKDVQPIPNTIFGYAISPSAVATIGYSSLVAHELGHTFDLEHTGCARIDDYGFHGNEQAQTVYKAESYYDFMNPNSPCGMLKDTQWVSSKDYLDIKEDLQPTSELSIRPRTVNSTQAYLSVAGVISSAIGTDFISLYTFTRTVGLDDDPGSGPYRLELRDETEQILFTRHFTGGMASADTSTTNIFFYEVVPRPAGTSKIVVWEGATQLGQLAATPHGPEVQFLTPLNNLTLTGNVPIEWIASDVDGDPLNHLVEYSADGGQSWRTLAVNLTQSSATVDANYLEGTIQGKFRVLASDGLNVGGDVSDGYFLVDGKVPQVTIVSPQSGLHIRPDLGVNLAGYAYDMEDGLLSDDKMIWELDGSTTIGIGQQAYVNRLSLGQHIITLIATDNDGNSGMGSVEVQVGFNIFLPLVQKE